MLLQRLLSRGQKGVAVATALTVAGLLGAPAVLAADTTPPSLPAGLTLAPQVSADGLVDLSWSASTSSDVQSYQLYRWHGTGTPAINESTYVGETAYTYYVDSLANEGQYRYAVVAVDQAGNKSRPTAWKGVTVNLPANGQSIAADSIAPGKPLHLRAQAAHVSEPWVDLSWNAPLDSDLWRYLVYRAKDGAAATFLGYVASDLTYYTDEVALDGVYTYYLVTQDLSGNLSAPSGSVTVTVDRVSPVVRIAAPAESLVYQSTGRLTVTTRVEESGSGYEAGAVRLFLDNQLLTSSVIRLDQLAQGTHWLQVEVTDRAGNRGAESVALTISDAVAFDAPELLTPSGSSSSRSLQLAWNAPAKSGVTGYTVHRVAPDGTVSAVANLGSTARSYTAALPNDGVWSFYVTARYGTTRGTPSAGATFVVEADRRGPAISIASPENGKSYQPSGRLPVQYTVSDTGTGVDAATVKLYLDGTIFAGSYLQLSNLTAGEHTLKVVAADLAGNESTATTRFTVLARTGNDDDDDDDDRWDDDDDDRWEDDRGFRGWLGDWSMQISATQKAKILQVLADNRDEMHRSTYKQLLKRAEKNDWRGFLFHLYKRQGKLISRDAARELLELFGLEERLLGPDQKKADDGGDRRGKGRGRDRDDD